VIAVSHGFETRSGAPIRVVLAEDHALVREGTRRILDDTASITVVGEAADGHVAVQVVDDLEPDLLVVDVGLPGMNGIEVTRAVKQRRPQISVLVLTVHDDDEYVFALLEAGAAGYLLKDVEGHELVHAIEAIDAGESVLHPAIAGKVLARLTNRAPDPAQPEGEVLSEREHEVLELAAKGQPNKQIAAQLGLSVRTVEAHLSHVFTKLNVGSRTEAVLHGLRHGWFDLDDLAIPP
jgi:DNA-binding NarL/FixJ family response regulator